MRLAILRETKPFENRVALSPEICKQLIQTGFECSVEQDAGISSFFENKAYQEAGAIIEADKTKLLSSADVIFKVNPLTIEEIGCLKKGAITISLFHAASNPDLVEASVKQGISVFSVDAIPRISRAQKMDVLSSQANLAGYKSVIIGAYHLGKFFLC